MNEHFGLAEIALGIIAAGLVAFSFTPPGRKYRGALVTAALAVGAFAAGRSSKTTTESSLANTGTHESAPPTILATTTPPDRDDALLDALASSEAIREEAADEVANSPDPSGLSDSDLADAIHSAIGTDDTDPG